MMTPENAAGSPGALADGRLIRRLVQGAASAFVINAVGVGLAFLAQLVAARLLGLESYGVFAYVTAWVLVLTTLATLGFEMGLLRFAATYTDRGDVARLAGVVQHAEFRVLLAGAAVAAAGLLALHVFRASISVELRTAASLGLVAVPLFALMRVRIAVVRAFGYVTQALLPDKAVRELLFILALLAVWIVRGGPLSAPVASGAALFGIAGGLLLVSHWRDRLAPDGFRETLPTNDDRATWRRTAWPLWILSLSQLAMHRVDVLLLGWLLGTSASGAFFACFVAAQVVMFPLVAVNILLSPTIAKLHAKGDLGGLQHAITTTSWWTTAGAILFAVPFFILAPYVLSLFGGDFAAYANVMRILIVGQLINAAAGSMVPLLSLTGREQQALSIALASFAAKLVLLLILIPTFGIIGTAVVEALFRAGSNLWMGMTIWRRLGVVPSIFGTFVPRRQPAVG